MKKEQKIFIVRLILFTLFACIIPFVFIAWRYDIFRAKPTAITGWGFIAIFIVVVFTLYTAKALKDCFPHTMFSQCVGGFCKVVLPLIILLLLVSAIKDNIQAFRQALVVTILSECIAIPINPLPKFIYDNNLEREDKRMDTFFKKFKDSWQEANKK